MKTIVTLLALTFATTLKADLYIGGNGGHAGYGSDITEKYKLTNKGTTYGGIVGTKIQFIGIEFLYQQFKTHGPIKHSGTEYELNNDVRALGAALRLNFNYFFFRIGYAYYKMEQNVTRDGTVQDNRNINSIYSIDPNGEKAAGFVGGAGLQMRLGKKFKLFAEYTRYNMSDFNAHYDAGTAGFIISLPDMNLKAFDIKSE